MNATILLPRLHPRQLEVARHAARFKALVCGRRWGKTRLGAGLGLETSLRGGRAWWVAPTYSQSSIAWRLAQPMAAQIPGSVIRVADMALLFPGGGEFWFKSADKPQNLRGEGLDLLVMDEADFIEGDVWEQALRPTLADRKGRALFISSPNIENGWFHRLVQKGAGDDPQWKSWSFPSHTNPFLDPAEIEDARKALSSIVFRREFLAEFVSAGGARVQRAWLKTSPVPGGLRIAMGVDLALSTKEGADYSAVAVIGRNAEGTTWVLDVQRVRAPFHQVLQFVRAMAERWNPVSIAVESVQFQAAAVHELLRTTTLPVVAAKADRDKLTRFQPLEARYEQGLVRHAPLLPSEFEQELLSFPVGEHDDQVDALAHAWSALDAPTASFKDLPSRSVLPRSRI